MKGTIWYRNEHCGSQKWFELVVEDRKVIEDVIRALSAPLECACCSAEFKSPHEGLSCGIDMVTNQIVWW